ncbi:MAG: hypothetical protein AB8H79_00850 [Myxococcota bacterium]
MVGVSLLLSLGALAEPGVKVLDLGPDPAEQAYVEELALGGVRVQEYPIEADFRDLTLTEQLKVIRPLVGSDQAVAWLVRDDSLTLAVAFVQDDRAVVRTVRTDADGMASARLALATREILASASTGLAPAPAATTLPSSPTPKGTRWVSVGLGSTVPLQRGALGPRVDLDVTLLQDWTRTGLGFGVGGSGNGRQGRGWARSFVRLGPSRSGLRVGAALDIVGLPWVVWAQPRIEVGTALFPHHLVGAELWLRFAPMRDRIVRGDDTVYDSGIAEISISMALRRQISPRRRQLLP